MPKKEIEESQWFAESVLPHEEGLRRWLKARFSAIRDLDDLVQETYTRILKAHKSGPVPNPQAFLFVVSRNIAINMIKRMNYEYSPESGSSEFHELVDEMACPYEAAALQEEIDDLVRAFQSLPNKCRQVMTLRKVYGLSQKEIADKLNISVHTVEAQVGIGLRKCRSYFHQLGYKTK